MNILIVADPIESFKIYKDTTFAMMRELQKRGHRVSSTEPRFLSWRSGQHVTAQVRHLQLTGHADDWYTVSGEAREPVHTFDAVLMRKDPPFDSEFFYATHMLEQAEREGARVFNSPRALRDHPEKLALMEFAQYAPPTLVTRNANALKAFHTEHRDIILKPLDGMGGTGIFRVGQDGMNLGAIVETLNQGGATSVMAQRYLPEIAEGDKRLLLIGGQVAPFVLARIPQDGEVRGNLAAGGKGVAQPLSDENRAVAEAIAPKLAARGLLLVGLDMIGNSVTEINVTSPTCFQEIHDQTGFDVASMFVDALELAMKGSPA